MVVKRWGKGRKIKPLTAHSFSEGDCSLNTLFVKSEKATSQERGNEKLPLIIIFILVRKLHC